MKTPIEIIDEMIDELNPEWFIPSNTDSIVTSYLREAKERIQKETWWISVEDRLPKIDTQVICFVSDWAMFYIDTIIYDCCWFVDWDYILPVTHWMPLPNLPNN
jgi:hypothetical protein